MTPRICDVQVALVHLGPSRPRWLVPSLRGIELAGHRPILVTDRDYWVERVPASVRVLRVRRRSVDRLEFRRGFWSLSTERFMALSEVHHEIGSAVLHVESDVKLAPSLDLSLLASLVRPVAFPVLSAGRGSGAVVYLRDPAASAKLASQLAASLMEKSGNDMEGLWSFWRENPSLVSLLPSTEPADDNRLAGSIGVSQVLESSHLREKLGGIFDSASYGQFIFGTDGRNSRFGFRILGDVSSDHFAQPRQERIASPRSWPLVVADGLQLLSLHIHSKDPRVLQSRNPGRHVAKTLGRRRRKMDPWALRTNVTAAAQRRVAKVLARKV